MWIGIEVVGVDRWSWRREEGLEDEDELLADDEEE